MDVQKKILIQYQFMVLKKNYKCYHTWSRKKHPQLTKSIYEKSTTYNMLSSEILKLFPKV